VDGKNEIENASGPADPGKLPRGKRADWLALGLLLLLPFIVYLPVTTGFATFAGFDHTGINQPLKELAYNSLRGGDLPVWEHRLDRGLPLFAEGEAGIFYPLNLLFFLPGDFLTIYNVVILLTLSTAGLLFYWWIRRFGVGPLAGFIAAAAHQWGATVNFNKANLNILEGFILAPLLLILLEPGTVGSDRRDRPWLRMVGIAAVFAMIVFAGQAQYVIYTGLFGFIYIVLRIVFLGKPGWKGNVVSMGLPFVGGAILGACLAAVQLLPTLELIPLSERGTQVISEGFSIRGLWLSPSRLFSVFIFPAYHYSLDHFLPYLSTTVYVGPIAILLAGYAIRFRKRLPKGALPVLFPMLAAGLIFLYLAMGSNTPLGGWLTSLGPLGHLRGHGRFGGYFATIIILLMGFGLDAFLRTPCGVPKGKFGKAKYHPLFSIEILLMLLLTIPFITGRAEYLETRYSLALMIGYLAIFFTGMLIGNLIRSRVPVVVAVVIALMIQVVGFHLTSSETLLVRSEWDANRADLVYISENSQSENEATMFAIRTKASVRLHERILSNGLTALEGGSHLHIDHLGSANAGLMEGLMVCNADLPLELARWEWLVHQNAWRKVDFTQGEIPEATENLLWILGVNWMVTENEDLVMMGFDRRSDPDWENRGVPYYIFERVSPVRPYAIYRDWTGTETGASEDQAREAFMQYLEEGSIGREVFLENVDRMDELEEEIDIRASEGRTTIMGDWESCSEYRVVVTTPSPGIFVLRDAWYPGWEVTVNGQKSELLRADLVYKAVGIGAGRNEVVFRYKPRYLGMGWLISGISLLVLMGIYLLGTTTGRGRKGWGEKVAGDEE